MKGTPDQSVVELIRARYEALSASERGVADLLLGSPHLMSGFTATELADAASVSKATLTRFVSKLGMQNFDEFRRAARAAKPLTHGSPLDLMAKELDTTRGDLGRLVAETVQRDTENLGQTYANLSMEQLTTLVELLSTSRRVVFADFRKQYALAYYAATLFRVIRPNIDTLPVLGASAVDGTLDIGDDDLVVMFPFRRPARDQDLLSRAVLDAGATLVTIGDVWPTPASSRATIHLSCHTEGVGVFDSFVTPMSLINLLFTATANNLGESALDRLRLLEDRHAMFETFVDGYEPPSRPDSTL